jgi:hypothetical protein
MAALMTPPACCGEGIWLHKKWSKVLEFWASPCAVPKRQAPAISQQLLEELKLGSNMHMHITHFGTDWKGLSDA